jgi:hypothetical protein
VKISKINPQSIALLRTAMQEAMRTLENEVGVNIRVGNCSYTDGACTFKVEVSTISADGTVIDKDRVAFEQLAEMYELKKEWLDKTFVRGGVEYRITGIAPRKRRLPVVVVRVKDNQRFCYSTEAIVSLMNAAPEVKK